MVVVMRNHVHIISRCTYVSMHARGYALTCMYVFMCTHMVRLVAVSGSGGGSE